MFLFFSRVRSSWKSSCTLWFVLADVSIKLHCHVRAAASPSLYTFQKENQHFKWASLYWVFSSKQFQCNMCQRNIYFREKSIFATFTVSRSPTQFSSCLPHSLFLLISRCPQAFFSWMTFPLKWLLSKQLIQLVFPVDKCPRGPPLDTQ